MLRERLGKVGERLDDEAIEREIVVDRAPGHAQRLTHRFLPPVYVCNLCTRIFGLVAQRALGQLLAVLDAVPPAPAPSPDRSSVTPDVRFGLRFYRALT